jgi:hypothetical protein
LLCIVLEKLWKKSAINNLIAGFVVGGVVFGKEKAVNILDIFRLMYR